MKLNRKKTALFTILVGVFALLISCNNGTPQVANKSSNASILDLRLFNDNQFRVALNTKFTIDDVNNFIFNEDSLPYGTKIDSLYLSFRFASSLGYIMNDTIAESYSFSQYANTSQHYNLIKPIKIKNLATDGNSTRSYKIEVRVHKVETYKHTWTQITKEIANNVSKEQKAILIDDKFLFFYKNSNGNVALSTSADAQNWSPESNPANIPNDAEIENITVYKNSLYLLYNQKFILKSKNGLQWEKLEIKGDKNYNYLNTILVFKDKIWAVAKDKNSIKTRIAYSNDGIKWIFSGKTTFNGGFPIKGFATTTIKPIRGLEKAVIIGGIDTNNKVLNSRWAVENVPSTDTLNWVNLNNETSNIKELSNSATTYYGSKILLIGGSDKDSKILSAKDQLRQSMNVGLTWSIPDSTTNVQPKDYIARENASLIIKDKSLYIIGGKSEDKNLSDVWKIRVNFYDFKDFQKY